MESEAAGLGLGAALLLGLGFGAGPCNIACLPYLGPVLFATGAGVRRGWRIIMPFSLGRLIGYSLIGLAAGAGGDLVTGWVEGPAVRWILGAATVLAALGLWLRLRRSNAGACAAGPAESVAVTSPVTLHASKKLLPGGLFFMGAGMALNPCAPLGTVTIAAAATARAVDGLTLGLVFGLGAAVIPALIFGLGVAHLGSELKTQLAHWRRGIEVAGVAMLALMGTTTAMGWMTP